MVHAHGEMEPIQDVFHWAARGRAHQRRQGGVAVADRGDRVALPPALVSQRGTQQGMRLLGHAAHQSEASGGVALMLDLAADRLEVANLVTGHGTYVSAIEHDDGPVFIRCCGLVRLVADSRDLRCCLPVGRLEPQGDRVGAVAHALLVRRRGGQQSLQDTRRVPKRGARAQLGLHPLQLRRAAGGQQRANGRDRPCQLLGRRGAAAAHLEPRRPDLNRAKQGLQPARAPVLERPQSLLHNRVRERQGDVFWCASVLTGLAKHDSIAASTTRTERWRTIFVNRNDVRSSCFRST